jgi:membrane protein
MLEKLGTAVLESKPAKYISAVTKKIHPPGFKGISLNEATMFFAHGLSKGELLMRASAISFRLTLALFPTIILFLSIIPYIPFEDFQENLMISLERIMPYEMFIMLQSALEDMLLHKHSGFLSIGFILTVYFASNGINAFLSGFKGSYNLPHQRNVFRQRILSLGLMLILTVLLMTGLFFVTFGEEYFTYLKDHRIVESDGVFALLYFVKWILVSFTFLLSISILFHFGKTNRRTWRIVSPGSIMATILTIFVSIGFSLSVHEIGHYNKLYGSLGSILVLLMMIYFNSVIMLIGFELNASIVQAKSKKD